MLCQMGECHYDVVSCRTVSVNNYIYFAFNFYRVSTSKSPGGKQVTITVRETKTERMTPVNQSYPGKRPFISFNTNDLSLNSEFGVCALFRWHPWHWTTNSHQLKSIVSSSSIFGHQRIGWSNGIFIGFQGKWKSSLHKILINNKNELMHDENRLDRYLKFGLRYCAIRWYLFRWWHTQCNLAELIENYHYTKY